MTARLRACVLIAAMFGIGVIVVGRLPGREVYASDCTSQLGNTEARHGSCGEHVASVEPAGSLLELIYVIAVLGFGALVFARPSPALAMSWSLFLIPGVVGKVLGSLDLAFFSHIEYGWATSLDRAMFTGFLLTIFPVTFAVAWKSKAEPLASARLLP